MKYIGTDTVPRSNQLEELMTLADTMASSAATLSRSAQNYDTLMEARSDLHKRLKEIFKA